MALLFCFSLRETEMNQPNELQLLKERAQVMGISHSPNIGVEALRAKVNAARDGMPDPGDGDIQPNANTEKTAAAGDENRTPARIFTRAELEQQEREKQWAEQLRLVRVRIVCLNPAKKDLQGEFFTVGNDYMGTVKHFIPYGEATDNGWHIPFVLYNELKSRQFNQVKTKKGIGPGKIDITQRLVSEFAIELLPDLTAEELQQLANQQAAAAGMA